MAEFGKDKGKVNGSGMAEQAGDKGVEASQSSVSEQHSC